MKEKELEELKIKKEKIIVDTREKKPIWNPDYFQIILKKLDEGDYTITTLYNKAHIERKSPIDLYGSIIQGHERFRKEIVRASEKGIKLAVFVECPEETFYRKRFSGGFRLNTPESTLRRIIRTIKKKYEIEFVWCEDRNDMLNKMLFWFLEKKEELLDEK